MRQNRKTIIGIIMVVLVLMVVLVFSGLRLYQRIQDGNARIAELEKQTEEEQQRTEEIKELQAYMQSDEYKEQVAKDKLGLIKDGEIIFKEE
ncbi:MAG: septum formation initiator family protein [Eubacteriales bacterium]|nr:septum formation initiator family protein [Eubacteriales bacterium]